MSRSAVKDILLRIDALPAKDRQQLERELMLRVEQEWVDLARAARVKARRGGVDQQAIDQAVMRVRYRGR